MKNLDNLQTLKTVCAIVKCEEEVYLQKVGITGNENLWKFPSALIEQNEVTISTLVNYLYNEFSLETKSNNINYFCNIKHKNKQHFLDIDAFTIDLEREKVKQLSNLNKKWVKIENLFDIPLTSEAITIAQVLMECYFM